MSSRQQRVKTTLWLIVGCLAVVSVARFKHGLGTTTALSDASPWGLWIAFDVMAGVALAAGGFVIAAAVHVLHLDRFQRFVRPAILTALLGYAAVAVGLLYDLGLPWHIWHPLVHPQVHSVLFEVAMCVMLYLTVLFLEFSPVVLEHPLLQRPLPRTIHRLLTRFTIPLVIAGIVLSTLHQSSLGSLFLIAPYRLHPLWYSPIIWVLFFGSAVGLGLTTVITESFFSAWFFGHRLRMDLLAGLGRAASFVLFAYVGVRLADLVARGKIGAAFDGSMEGFLFISEVLVSALVPAVILSVPRIRESRRGLGIAALLTVVGMIGYRFNVCLVAFTRPEGMSYFPSWMELVVTLGIVAGAILVFLFFVEHLRVYPEEESREAQDVIGRREPSSSFLPQTRTLLLPESIEAPRRYSLAVLVGASLAVAALPSDALFGPSPERTPVARARVVEGALLERVESLGHEMSVISLRGQGAMARGARATSLMVIDGNRDGRQVLFPHDNHIVELGGDGSCGLCHHQSLPFQSPSACYLCHGDMYIPTDIFDHGSHVRSFDGNRGCARCHANASVPRTRATSTPCLECHVDMLVDGSRIDVPQEGVRGVASGYMQAMHGLCLDCHQEKSATDPQGFPDEFGECLGCHRDAVDSAVQSLAPYAAFPATKRQAVRTAATGGGR